MKNFALAALALLLASSAFAAEAAADPRQWLEDIESPRALDWVKTRDEKTMKELQADPRYKKVEADARAVAARAVDLQLLAGSQVRARRVAPRRARGVPQALAALGDRARSRRALEGGKRELGLEGRRLPPAGAEALPADAVARRKGRVG